MPTKIITNFSGRLTRDSIGDLNSGLAKYETTFAIDPFSNVGNLTWLQLPTQIGASVITDLIVAAQPRLENGVTYVYAIGSGGRFYKIQVNDPGTHNPAYNNAVLLTTLTINTPTFKYGSSIQFYGATEKIYVGHDVGVTSVNFDGSGEAFVGTPYNGDPTVSWTANVPRLSAQFLGVSYWGNGNNLAAIDSTATVSTYGQLSPAFPSSSYVKDLDVSPDGNYLQIVVTRTPPADMTVSTQDTSSLSPTSSYLFYWNGTDTGYTSYTTFNSYTLTSNTVFGDHSYIFGYDLSGAGIYTGSSKILTLPNSLSPSPEAVFSTSNMVGYAAPEQVSGVLKGSIYFYGKYDQELEPGLFRVARFAASGSQTDVVQIPVCLPVSNLFYGSSSSGYSGNKVGSSLLYFSTLETSASTTAYKFYVLPLDPDSASNLAAGVYETQQETYFSLFRSIISKKFAVKEVRVYGDPWTANNSFEIDLIGSAGTPMSNGSYTFSTANSTLTIGQDFAKYNPAHAPTYSLGLRITNTSSSNNNINKVEVDYQEAGT